MDLKQKYEEQLKAFDESIDRQLVEVFSEIELKSKALAISLKRCFNEARSSQRFEYAYQMGMKQEFKDCNQQDLLTILISPYEDKDFEIFREFIRLLRACSLHIGGRVSQQIRDCYNKTFKEDRVLLAYKLGVESSK
ncbi:MAG: hypothetical protein QNJ31_04450 [Candidatus Caenarcaniphilales bacterium]|nr:hypothetical protein [Candidatus Caenarcaniphilales bacterium]